MSNPRESRSAPLDRFLMAHPPLDVMDLWDAAVHDAFLRSGRLETPEAATWLKQSFLALRKEATSDLVSFHREVTVTPYGGADVSCPEGFSPWRVEFVLSLLPKRRQGFARVECLLEFYTDEARPDAYRLLAVRPGRRSEVKAVEAVGGTLQLEPLLRFGRVEPLPQARAVQEVVAEHYGAANPSPYRHDAVRTCVAAEVRGATEARWRLDAPVHNPGPGAESHTLTVILAVAQGAPALHAAGLLWAFSQENWLDDLVGRVWRDFERSVREFLLEGAPSQVHGEWLDIIVPS
ncbi:hypothetical protein LZ198_07880 [Myxococcus sp. K15C18031901]|uniref:hypothetical protein n=1 Tax=Myxococcus dinghuensis TaxID=2906761 RepID=UPI0020A6E584|nr:hypothetical protein [Myxococcus dinghuensis]MCP3098792.1 hypothetical protein [Myxococcus dinghuensis]